VRHYVTTFNAVTHCLVSQLKS